MTEPTEAGRPELRSALATIDPTLELLAEDVLLEKRRIAGVARAANGRLVAIVAGAEGEDAALLTRALAALVWLRPRVGDWAQLAPERLLDPRLPPAALILCPRFDSETLAAAASLPGEPVRLAAARAPATTSERRESPAPDPALAPTPGRPAGRRSIFRTGLVEDDLGQTA